MESKERILEAIKNINAHIHNYTKKLEYYNNKLIELESKPKWSFNYDRLLDNEILPNKNKYLLLGGIFGSVGTAYINNTHYNKLEALRKLQLLRHEIVVDWNPNWGNRKIKYCIDFRENLIIKCNSYDCFSEFSFETAEQRDWFGEKHIELLRVYYGVN